MVKRRAELTQSHLADESGNGCDLRDGTWVHFRPLVQCGPCKLLTHVLVPCTRKVRLEVIHYTMDQMRILAVLPFWFWYGLLELEKWAGRWKDVYGMLCCNRKVMFVHEGKALIGFVGFQCEADVYFSPNMTVM